MYLVKRMQNVKLNIPDFTGKFENYSSYFANGPKQALKDWGFDVEFVYASDLYKQGKYDEYLDLYIEYEDKLQDLMETITGSRMDSLISIAKYLKSILKIRKN